MDIKLFSKKQALLTAMLMNLKKEEELLIAGDADHALLWEEENLKILQKLEKIDKQIESSDDSLPFSESEISLSSSIFHVLEEARAIQKRVHALLEIERDNARDELNEVAVRRQLKMILRNKDGLDWKKRIC
ncbi:flagellar protein FlgN [Leptospira sp. GIMC2001]|uniref:flagellar protein FlgN n=1 Tax=Leptospira sp. GIMC2001 TaxID=1513297 RepID=UPI00234A22FB|nr:flagellar protein FlgN [Leptospira sp. GIMC2001]WCL50938.1 flagellar protein FlgN [Leptospira sp. GIMC2001]